MSLSIKSQVSMETIMLVSILLFGSTLLTAASYYKTAGYDQDFSGQRANQILNKAVERINTVFFEGHGFSSSLYLDDDVLGEEYNISISNGLVLLEFRNNIVSKKVVAPNITGSLSKGNNWVSNENGVIVLS